MKNPAANSWHINKHLFNAISLAALRGNREIWQLLPPNQFKNYIGGATFLELYEAFMNNKKIYLYHDIPEGMLFDEISGFDPIIIHEDLGMIEDNGE